MKKAFIIFSLALSACSSPKQANFITRDLPKGLELSDFTEKYDSYNGQYVVSFMVKNVSDKILSMPSLTADFYIADKKRTAADGGADHELGIGESGSANVSTVLGRESADSVIFKFNGWFDK